MSFEAGGAVRLFRHGLRGDEEDRRRPRPDAAHQRHQRAARANAASLALAMGATKILGTGRNQKLLDRVKALAPGRIEVLSVPNAPSQPSPASGGGQGGGASPANPDPLVAWAK